MSAKPSLRIIILWLTVLFAPLATAMAQSFVHPRDQIALQLGAAQMGYELPFTLTGANMQRACNALVMGRNALDAAVGKPAVKVKDVINSPNVETLEYRDQLYSAVEHVFRSPVVGTLKGSVVMADNKKVSVNVKLSAPPSSWTIPVPFAMEAGSFADESALKAQISALSQKVDSLTQSLATVTQNLSSLTTKATSLEKGVDATASSVTVLSQNLTSLEKGFGNSASTVSALSQNLTSLSAQASLIERSVGATASDFNRLKASVLSAGATLDYERTSVATLAGSGEFGTADGNGLAAGFSDSTSELVFDGAGNLYLADGARIRKVTPTGVVTTFAGSGAAGLVDGTGLSANFIEIKSLSADGSGNLYLIDGGRIRKVTPERVVTTWTVVTEGAPLSFDSEGPELEKTHLLTLDTLGNVYALARTGSGSRRLLKISTDARVTTLAGSDGNASIDGVGTGASFGQVVGIITDSLGNVYVSENEGSDSPSKIRKVTPAGTVTTLTKPPGSAIRQMVADQSGNVFGVSTMQGPSTFGDFGFQYEVILKVAPDGAVTVFAGSERDGIYGDLRDGVGQKAALGRILSMNTDAHGNLYFASRDDARYVAVLRKVSAMGVVSTLAGLGSGDGSGEQAGFSATVTGIAPDKAGNVYVLDAGAYKIRKISFSP